MCDSITSKVESSDIPVQIVTVDHERHIGVTSMSANDLARFVLDRKDTDMLHRLLAVIELEPGLEVEVIGEPSISEIVKEMAAAYHLHEHTTPYELAAETMARLREVSPSQANPTAEVFATLMRDYLDASNYGTDILALASAAFPRLPEFYIIARNLTTK
jgi:hypothetical protein